MMLLGEAQANLKASKALNLNVERVSLADALGRIAAKDVLSEIAIPPADNSAMDGFAINSEALVEGERFTISQRLPAGTQSQPCLLEQRLGFLRAPTFRLVRMPW